VRSQKNVKSSTEIVSDNKVLREIFLSESEEGIEEWIHLHNQLNNSYSLPDYYGD
jgi:hypothetical protein